MKIALFGVTDLMSLRINEMKRFGTVDVIYDNDESKQGSIVNGILVCSPKKIGQHKEIVVIATEYMISANQISQQLENIGLEKNKNYFFYKDFLIHMGGRSENQEIVIPQIDLVITNVCSLQCANCALYINHQKEKYQRNICEIIEDLESLFHSINHLSLLNIIGGEPLLYNQIDELLNYIGKNYIEKIGQIVIITNGTIIPSKRTLEICSKYDISFSISDYSETIHYKVKIQRLCNILKEYHIAHKSEPLKQWSDLGNPYKSRNRDEKQLQSLYTDCNTRCKCLFDNKIFLCTSEASMVMAKMHIPDKEDYIDLKELAEMNQEEKSELIINLYSGEKTRGYLSFCQYCDGYGEQNKNIIKPAIQESEDAK